MLKNHFNKSKKLGLLLLLKYNISETILPIYLSPNKNIMKLKTIDTHLR